MNRATIIAFTVLLISPLRGYGLEPDFKGRVIRAVKSGRVSMRDHILKSALANDSDNIRFTDLLNLYEEQLVKEGSSSHFSFLYNYLLDNCEAFLDTRRIDNCGNKLYESYEKYNSATKTYLFFRKKKKLLSKTTLKYKIIINGSFSTKKLAPQITQDCNLVFSKPSKRSDIYLIAEYFCSRLTGRKYSSIPFETQFSVAKNYNEFLRKQIRVKTPTVFIEHLINLSLSNSQGVLYLNQSSIEKKAKKKISRLLLNIILKHKGRYSESLKSDIQFAEKEDGLLYVMNAMNEGKPVDTKNLIEGSLIYSLLSTEKNVL